MVLLITLVAHADLLPPYPTVTVREEVMISNVESFSDFAVLSCSFDMGGALKCSILKNNQQLTKYKFAEGVYLIAIEKQELAKMGGVGALSKAPQLEEFSKRLRHDHRSPIGHSTTIYEKKDATHTKDITTTSIYEITKIEDGKLYFRLKNRTTR